MSGPTVFLSAGEVSGDMHGAHLARAILALRPDVKLVGVGGPRMAEAGVELVADVTRHSAVGLTENLPHVLPVMKAFKQAERLLAERRPAAVVLVDYQGANMALAKKARALGLPTVYYILPQEWLWGFKRGAAKVASGVDHLIAVFAREAEVYRQAGGRVHMVGHPLLDILEEERAPEKVLALMPGSREQEVRSLLPVFLATAKILHARRPDLRFVLPLAGAHLEPLIREAVAKSGLPIELVTRRGPEVLARAEAALVASGTVTLEAAILGVPCVAAYRVSALTAWLAKRLLKVPFVTLPNIVAGREVVPEFLQAKAEPQQLAEAIEGLLAEGPARDRQLEGYAEVRRQLGERGAIDRAARVVLEAAGLSVTLENPVSCGR